MVLFILPSFRHGFLAVIAATLWFGFKLFRIHEPLEIQHEAGWHL